MIPGDLMNEAAEVFRDAWLQADAEGDKGNRVKRGLEAINEWLRTRDAS